ncbi:MAG TPA: hypothetical protein DEQ02_04225 [Ruminococcaceae bacterium]|nr:hypothetical protein [Oscillospiraceae bacterium]
MLANDNFQRISQNNEVSRESLVNIEDVQIDQSLPIIQRMEEYLAQVKNPYHFLCGDTPVKISFLSTGKSLSEKLAEHFIRKKSE